MIFIALPLALFIAAIGVAACIWATRCGQFDDLETPALRVIVEDDLPTDR